MSDNVNHPSHYAEGWSNGAEVIDITEHLNFNRGNAVKYIARAGRKAFGTELEDLRKAIWYCQREILRVEAGYQQDIADISVRLADLPLEHVWAPDDEDELPSSVVNLDEDWHREHVWKDTSDGDFWSYSEGEWGFDQRGDGDWLFGAIPGSSFGPYTIVVQPRMWRTLADAPINIKVESAAGYEWQHDSGRGWVRPDIPWLPVDPNWRVSYGPWTEVL